MKTIIKLLITLAVLNAVARGAMASYSYYLLRDAAEQTIMFGGQKTIPQLQDQIVLKAEELSIPLKAESVSVTRVGVRTLADGRYTQAIEFFPNFRYPWEFSFAVEVFSPLSTPQPK